MFLILLRQLSLSVRTLPHVMAIETLLKVRSVANVIAPISFTLKDVDEICHCSHKKACLK